MKTKFYRVCEVAFKLGIPGFFVAFACAWLPVIIHVFLKTSYNTGFLKALSVVGFFAFFLFFFASLLLWVEGFLDVLRSFKTRSATGEVLLILFLIFFTFFAAFILHGIKRVRIAKALNASNAAAGS